MCSWRCAYRGLWKALREQLRKIEVVAVARKTVALEQPSECWAVGRRTSTAFLQGPIMDGSAPPTGVAWAVHMSPHRTADLGSRNREVAPVHLWCCQTGTAGAPSGPEL